jgi:hypothetical protein
MGIAVAVDKRANAYVAGWLEDRTTFYSENGKNITITGFSPAHRDTNYPRDAYLVKYDSQGNAKWVNHIGGYVDQAEAVRVSPFGEVTLVGYIGNINYDLPVEKTAIVTSQLPGRNRILGGAHFTNPFNEDAIIATWNSAGVLTRATRIGGPANEAATGIAYDAQGLLYLSAPASWRQQSAKSLCFAIFRHDLASGWNGGERDRVALVDWDRTVSKLGG